MSGITTLSVVIGTWDVPSEQIQLVAVSQSTLVLPLQVQVTPSTVKVTPSTKKSASSDKPPGKSGKLTVSMCARA